MERLKRFARRMGKSQSELGAQLIEDRFGDLSDSVRRCHSETGELMLAMLLDENISDEIARQVSVKRPNILIFSVNDWEQGRLRSVNDEEVLWAAQEAALTLVTYDVNTIPLLLVRLANESSIHSGVVFVHNATVRSNAYGSLTRALIQLYDAERDAEWENRLLFLPPPR